MSKNKHDVVTIKTHKAPDPNKDSVRYVVQVWMKRDFLFLVDECTWVDQNVGHKKLEDALKQASSLREQYAKVRVTKRTVTNEVVA